jgi:hypothetical protein
MRLAIGRCMTKLSTIDISALANVTGGAGDNYNQNWSNAMNVCATAKGASSPSGLSGSDWSSCSNWAHGVANGKDPTAK